MKDTMKTQKRLWIALIAFGLFAIIFCRWVYVKDTARENLSLMKLYTLRHHKPLKMKLRRKE